MIISRNWVKYMNKIIEEYVIIFRNLYSGDKIIRFLLKNYVNRWFKVDKKIN